MKVLSPITTDDQMLAGLPYLFWPIGSAFILASKKKEDPFLYYHAIQALLWGAGVLVSLCAAVIFLAVTFRLVPSSGGYFSGLLGVGILFGAGTIGILVFFSAIFLGWRATEGEMLKIPFLGNFAENKMLDSTGMTRKDFMEMLKKSVAGPEVVEESIPFPAMPSSGVSISGQTTEALGLGTIEEAMPASMKAAELLAKRQAGSTARQNKSPAGSRDYQNQAPAPLPQAPLPRELPKEPVVKNYSLIGSKPPKPPVATKGTPMPLTQELASEVKEIDLVRHYKERKKPQKPNADVLRNWLSSVDE